MHALKSLSRGSIVAFSEGPFVGVGAVVPRSGSRWVGCGSASQTDAQKVDLTLRGVSGLTGLGGSLCLSAFSGLKSDGCSGFSLR